MQRFCQRSRTIVPNRFVSVLPRGTRFLSAQSQPQEENAPSEINVQRDKPEKQGKRSRGALATPFTSDIFKPIQKLENNLFRKFNDVMNVFGRGGMHMPSLFSRNRDPMDQLFDEMQRSFAAPVQQMQKFVPHFDIEETDKEVTLVCDIPGVPKENLKVKLLQDQRLLTIKGERKEEHTSGEKENLCTTRVYGSFFEQYQIPETVDIQQISAKYADGALTVKMPKIEHAEAAGKDVEISS